MLEIGWTRICCPVDFSEESYAALRVAVDLCRRLGAELTLLYVEEDGQVAGAPAEAWRKEAADAGVKTTTAHARGDPQTAIPAWALREGADAIVMGTHGRTGRALSLVGSVAEATVRNARCPVMVVHAEWQPPPA